MSLGLRVRALGSLIFTMAASSSLTTPERGSTLKTPWPPAKRSTTSPLEWARTERDPASTNWAEARSAPRSSRRHWMA